MGYSKALLTQQTVQCIRISNKTQRRGDREIPYLIRQPRDEQMSERFSKDKHICVTTGPHLEVYFFLNVTLNNTVSRRGVN